MPEPSKLPSTRDAVPDPHPSVTGGSTATGSAPVPAPPPDPDDPAFRPPAHPGDLGRAGRYRVLRRLGKGGMGAVYLGSDEHLGRRVALKVMLPRYAASPIARERFVREARSAARVQHEHVVGIYDVNEDAGVVYIAMEYLQGYPLDEYLKAHAADLTVPQILRVGREVAAGLAAAHALGIVHRDIKPANLWLEAPQGRIKILDFGLAKPVSADGEESAHLTNTGAVVGTPAYMSPEQARGERVDFRSDLFSLGAVLYRLTTGRQPFRGGNAMAVLTALAIDTPTPVRELNPNVPPPLEDLIARLLAKRPGDRPPTAEAVAGALAAIEFGLARGDHSIGDAVPLATAAPEDAPAIFVPVPVEAYDAGAFAGLGDPSSEAVPGTAPKVPRLPPKRGGVGPGVWAAAGACVVLAAVLGVVAVKTLTAPPPRPDEDPDPVPVVAATGPGRKKKDADPPPPPPPDVALNGKDLTGWTPTGGTWAVEGGDIVGTRPAGGGWEGKLVLDRRVKDFDLSFEAKSGNPAESQASFNFRDDGRRGLGLRLAAVPGRVYEVTPTGGGPPLYDAPRNPDPTFIPFRVRAVGDRVTVWANGAQVADLDRPGLPGGDRLTFQLAPNSLDLRIRHVRLVELPPPDPTFFDGKTLDAWGPTRDAGAWKVENGEIVGTRTAGTDGYFGLGTRGRKVTDFELAFEARAALDPGRAHRYCSVQFRTSVDNYGAVQIAPGPGHLGVIRDAKEVARLPASAVPGFDPSVFNRYRLRVVGTRVTVDVNGVRVNDADLPDLPATGGLLWGLQDGCTELRVRNVVFRDLARPADLERAAAEFFNPHADLSLDVDGGRTVGVPMGAPLPAGLIRITRIGVRDSGMPDKEAFFRHVETLPKLGTVSDWFDRLKWTDADLARLANAPAAGELRTLQLVRLELSPAGIATLKRFPNLKDLSIRAAEADDALLGRLAADLPGLTGLGLHAFGDGGRVTAKGVAALAAVPNLRYVNLFQAQRLDRAWFAELARFPELKRLSAPESNADDAMLAELVRSRTIDNLDVGGSKGVTDAGLRHLAELPTLKTLRLVNKTGVTGAGVKVFAAARPDVKVEWDGGTIDPDPKAAAGRERKAAAALLPHCNVLRVRLPNGEKREIIRTGALPDGPFTVYGANFWSTKPPADFVPTVLLPAAADLPGLEEVSAFGGGGGLTVSAADLAALARLRCAAGLTDLQTDLALTRETAATLKAFPKLTHLAVSGAEADDAALAGLAEHTGLTRLIVVQLGASGRATPAGTDALAGLRISHLLLPQCQGLDGRHFRGIARIPTLTYLDLNNNSLGDDVAAALADSPSLKSLHWPGRKPNLTDAGLEHLARLKNLRELAAKSQGVTAAGVKKLAAANPDLKITWDGGVIEPAKK